MNILAAHTHLSEYIQKLQQLDAVVHEVPCDALSRYSSFSQYDAVLIESTEEGLRYLGSEALCLTEAKVIFAGNTEHTETACRIKNAGFVRFIAVTDILPVLKRYNTELVSDSGRLSLLLFDENQRHYRIVKQLCADFGHSISIVEDFDHFYQSLSSKFDFILINVHSSGCDVPVFSRKVHNVTNFKKAAVLPFMEKEHCEISDITAGLNKIAKVVLNLDELVHFLIHIFYKRELETNSQKLLSEIQDITGSTINYSDRPSVAYGEHGVDFILSKPDISRSGIDLISDRNEILLGLHSTMLPYIWLVHTQKGVTCGPGA